MLSRSRDPEESESLSLDAGRKRRTFVSAVVKPWDFASLSDVRNPVWRTTARQFGCFLQPDSQEIYDIISRKERPFTFLKNHRHIPFRFDVFPRLRRRKRVVCRVCQVRKSFSPETSRSWERHFTIDFRKQWKLLSGRAWHAWQTHTLRANATKHFALTVSARAKRNYH